ncbi:hypothetical protein [Alcaligenes sp. SJTW-7]|uniref:hypothetical protein n=1 Tax=Alcaligenes sp. SJTW-7 TaxID=3078429 RepID=UPI0039EB4F71
MDYPKSLPGIGLVGGKFADANPVTGTPGSWISAAWANSLMDELLGIIDAAGFTPSEVDNGQVLKAIRALAMPIYLTAPADNVGPLVYVIDRQQILHWQTVGTFTGYVSPNVGRFVWGTSTSPRPDEVDAIGQTVDRTNPRFQALIAWAESNGHMVASGAWTKGAFRFSVISGSNVRMPDLRDQFIRATGTDADTANARALGSAQSGATKMLSIQTLGQFIMTSIKATRGCNSAFSAAAAVAGGQLTRRLHGPLSAAMFPAQGTEKCSTTKYGVAPMRNLKSPCQHRALHPRFRFESLCRRTCAEREPVSAPCPDQHAHRAGVSNGSLVPVF